MSSIWTASAVTQPPASQTGSVQQLLRVLKHPEYVLGPAVPSGLTAEYEGGEWEAADLEVREVLAAHDAAPEVALRVLAVAARFLALHGLRLCGNPWLHVQRFRDVAGISYVLHLDLDREDAITWNDRFYEVLASADLLNDVFSLNLRKRGPIR